MDTAIQDRIARGATGRPDAADADPSSRPGVPMIKPSGTSAPIGKPALDQQQTDVTVLVGVDVGKLPPVFGTAQPPRGLSGLMRRSAYKIPEHKAGRWMMLLMADRVDVWESRMRRHPILSAVVVAAVIGGVTASRPRRSKARRLIDRLA
jgi:hypothetical protein